MTEKDQTKQDDKDLSRGLTSRHVQMIAIEGAIGTGLFLGSGTAIKSAGPALILAYLITGLFSYLMMRAVGELLLSNTKLHSFIDFVREYLGDRWEFAIGWAYWLSWASLAMADLTASGIYLRFWFPQLPQWVTPLIVVAILVAFNLINVAWFGELESAFSSIKIFAILALIVAGVGMIAVGFHTQGNTASLANLVDHGGFFATGAVGFILAFPMVIFAFTGIEMVGLTAGETKDPQKDIPKAINSVPVRILLFYIGSMIVIMSVYPWNQINPNQSPFVQVFSGLGISYAANIINFVVLTSALSAANSAIFSTSRTLFILGKNGQAPKSFAKLSRNNVPYVGILVSSMVFLGIVLLNYFYPSKIFVLITGVATISFIFVWIIIMITHIQYKKTVGNPLDTFKMPFFPYSSYATIIFYLAVLVTLMFNFETRISVIATVIFFAALIVGYVIWDKKKKQKLN
ncbi:amino acid permease [Fructilactobacillus lindneri]|uniref:Amino-acid permease aapA n=1 Tax=Fructilactobacillus lindneri DSM 20690 = JCM 11027 TaxID=1122148 RepID=A0A0R2JNA5_9LACO|nr:amino acid permease [Fructilactobacillus lindneri]KRN78659.1 amino-acid permease aapA [Fructilactobacillus lindneri DSM 20690 = JCM 11027]POH06514.1 amino acid permease [Fructilactobacillus lindneri]POH06889.1 amino acid permease [Fructilactobacillus lindneri]POH07370.1 amino acid permease [Fructilactobacillus lindneri]POH24055.1 amino acid permease [Fructilactobacillus lindneri DSM 20690 = JCM 11027]